MSPTYEHPAAFYREYLRMGRARQRRFRIARDEMVRVLAEGGNRPDAFPPKLRIKRVQGHTGIWEITFAPDGRATFSYGDAVRDDQPIHIIWRRIGDHSILDRP